MLLEPDPEVEEVIMDLEVDMWSAVRNVYPNVHPYGCTLCLAKAMWRKALQVGLASAYIECMISYVSCNILLYVLCFMFYMLYILLFYESVSPTRLYYCILFFMCDETCTK